MKLAWLTDPHLNFLSADECNVFYQTMRDACVDAVLITGDIAESSSLSTLLSKMAHVISKPIYFVLGNHDYHRNSIESVRSEMVFLTKNVEHLNWLPAAEQGLVLNDVMLVGVDGFADGRYGNFEQSPVQMSDHHHIAEFFQAKLLSQNHLLAQMQKFADEDAQKLLTFLEGGIGRYNPRKIIVLTHVPPFPEVCLYEGKQSNDHYLPYFASKATGDTLLRVAEKYPLIEIMVLAGHTHHAAQCQMLPNLNVKVGTAEYYTPQIQEIFYI